MELNQGDGDLKLGRRQLDGFLKRNKTFKVVALHSVESSRAEEITAEHCCKQIARIIAAIKRYNITKPILIFNIDEWGVSFKDMTGRKSSFGSGKEK